MSVPSTALAPATHAEYLERNVIPRSGLSSANHHEVPRAVVLAGQPGAGKRKINDAAKIELGYDVVPIDPDDLRDTHPDVERLRQQHPYTWAGHTHEDASQWAKELRSAAIDGRRNLILDTTLGNGDSAVALIKDLQANGYEVEIRGVVAHRLESELGVDGRFSDSLDTKGLGCYVPLTVVLDGWTALEMRPILSKGNAARSAPTVAFRKPPDPSLEAQREARRLASA